MSVLKRIIHLHFDRRSVSALSLVSQLLAATAAVATLILALKQLGNGGS
jgi:hypothetical protein